MQEMISPLVISPPNADPIGFYTRCKDVSCTCSVGYGKEIGANARDNNFAIILSGIKRVNNLLMPLLHTAIVQPAESSRLGVKTALYTF